MLQYYRIQTAPISRGANRLDNRLDNRLEVSWEPYRPAYMWLRAQRRPLRFLLKQIKPHYSSLFAG